MEFSLEQLADILGYDEETVLKMLDETETNELQVKLYINVRQDENQEYTFDNGELIIDDSFVADYSDREEDDWEWEPMDKWLY